MKRPYSIKKKYKNEVPTPIHITVKLKLRKKFLNLLERKSRLLTKKQNLTLDAHTKFFYLQLLSLYCGGGAGNGRHTSIGNKQKYGYRNFKSKQK